MTFAESTLERQPPPAAPPPTSRRLPRIVRGRPEDPRWVRPALLAILAGTALLYLWNLSSSGYANDFYAAASQSGGKNWTAWFFGSLDPSNAITVDKPPASLWVSGLSVRLFGLSSWSVLAPQALEGVAAVGLLYATVRRTSGAAAGLLAAGVLATTPAAALMFRYNHPDALLVLLLVAGAYALIRAVERASAQWLMLAGTALGFAFLTKMLQAFLVLPAFALVYLVAAPTSLRRQIGHVLLAGLAIVVSAGWWIVAAAAWPASARPYIGGSTNNSVLQLVFGYNGFGRLFGQNGGGGGGMSGGVSGSSFGGATGLFRIFGSEMGFEISWLLPAAIVALVAAVLLTRGARRTSATRTSLMLWGGWLLVTALVFDYMKGIVHPYYTVALAPAIAGLIGVGVATAWRHRQQLGGSLSLAAITATAGGWSFVLLSRNSSWHPALRWAILITSIIVAAGWLLTYERTKRLTAGLAIAGLLSGLAGPAAYAVATAAHAHSGSIPSVGPVTTAAGFGGGSGGGPGASGGLGGSSNATASTALIQLLQKTDTRWAAAIVGAMSAAPLQLSSGKAVMAIGGFNGGDNSPTLAQFEAYVKAGKISYFISGGQGMGGGGMGGSSGSAIASWVAQHYKSTTVGGYTVYDLTSTTS
jgi:4-amino-4-deoxy-L-arabinose transferase-like glycosyltransferase